MVAPDTVVERLCRLPRDFRSGSLSPVAIVDASGYLDDPDVLTQEAVLSVLRADPILIDDWEIWSMDRRSTEGWVFRNVDGQFEVFHFSIVGYVRESVHTIRGGHYIIGERLTFDDRFDACAEYVVREIAFIAKYARKPN